MKQIKKLTSFTESVDSFEIMVFWPFMLLNTVADLGAPPAHAPPPPRDQIILDFMQFFGNI